MRADEPGDHEELREQQRDRDVQQHAVIVVLRHQRHDFFGRVVRVLAEDRVGERHEQERVGEREDGGERVAAAQKYSATPTIGTSGPVSDASHR